MNLPVRFLGVGGAFDTDYGSSAALIDTGAGTRLLIDSGCSTYRDLKGTGLVDTVTHVAVTHMHDDHVGSLGTLVFHHYYITHRKLVILAPPPLIPLLIRLFESQMTHGPVHEFVTIRELARDGSCCDVGETQLQFIDTFGLHQAGMPTFGYVLKLPDLTIAYSGDLGDPNIVFNALAERHITDGVIFHDVAFMRLSNKAHAYYKDIEANLGSFKLWGYHNNPSRAPADNTLPLVYHHPELLATKTPL